MSGSGCTGSDAKILELRIHGVNNTSPPAMLDLDPDAVVLVAGDDLGGFWRAKPGVLDCIEPPARGWTPTGVLREGYSWGGLARTSPGGWGPGIVKTVMAAFGRIAWVLLIPFGLANVSYWSRRLPTPDDPPQLRGGRGAVGQRIFALALTVLFVVTVCEVAMDMVARQCFRDQQMVCASLPSQLAIVQKWEPANLLAVFSLVPIAFLLGLWWVTGSSRSRYEQFTAEDQVNPELTEAIGIADTPRFEPLLGKRDFWTGAVMLRGLLSLHLATSFAVVTLFSSLPALVGRSPACQSFRDIVGSSVCVHAIRDRPAGTAWFALTSVVAVLVAGASACRLGLRSTDAPDQPRVVPTWWRRWFDRGLLPLSCALVGLELLLLVVVRPQISGDGGLTAAAAAPTLLAALLLGLAASSLVWRWRLPASGSASWHRVLPPLVGLLVTVGLLAPVLGNALSWVLGGLGLVALVGAYNVPAPLFVEHRAWRGRAPAFFQAIAVMSSMTLASLVVLTTGDWLNGGNPASSLIESHAGAGGTDPVIKAPSVYVWFGMLSLAGLALTLLALLACYLRGLAQTPPLPVGTEPVPGAGADLTGDPVADEVARARRRARRFAAFAQRAELYVRFLVLIGSLAVAVAVVASAAEQPLFEDVAKSSWLSLLASWSTQAVVVVGLAGVTALVGGKAVGGVRPLGLVWDLVCFLPRAAHPLGPPCYAERAVPEITDRCVKWLAPPGKPPQADRRIVLSAHSLGSVLAVSVLLHFPGSLRQLSLLTYGSQLRAYFGRLFPELLGPDVLGVAPSPGPALLDADAWHDEQGMTVPAHPRGPTWPTTLVDRLRTPGPTGGPADPGMERVRWRNLWRRTDYLGFPVQSYQATQLDNPAQEIDNTGYMLAIGSHSDYPRAVAYEAAFDSLVALDPPGPG